MILFLLVYINASIPLHSVTPGTQWLTHVMGRQGRHGTNSEMLPSSSGVFRKQYTRYLRHFVIKNKVKIWQNVKANLKKVKLMFFLTCHLIWKDSDMHGLAVYVKKGIPFAWCCFSFENSEDSFLLFQIVLLHWEFYFFPFVNHWL